MTDAKTRADAFCGRFGITVPVLLAPMAAVSPVALSAAVANAGGMGGCGALQLDPDAIAAWAREFRASSNGAFQMNLWIPDPPPQRDAAAETRVRDFLGAWGPPVAPEAGNVVLPDFADQCEALLGAGPQVVSSIMGLYPADFVVRLKARGIAWFACVTSLAEAQAAEAAGADALVVQGMEAGGHRGAFDAGEATRHSGTLFALLPRIADHVRVPLIAAGGIVDGRSIAAALTLGASAVQMGTAFLRSPEAAVHPAWSAALARTEADDTVQTRAFSGRLARSVATPYVVAAADGPPPAPYPVQRGLTAGMRAQAERDGDGDRMQLWAGQGAAMTRVAPAGDVLQDAWNAAKTMLPF
jgi:nitronate monooxygenase